MSMETVAAVIGTIFVAAKAALKAIEMTTGITPQNADEAEGFRKIIAIASRLMDRISFNPDDSKARKGKPKVKSKPNPTKQSGYAVLPLLLVLAVVSAAGCSVINRPDVETPEERLGEVHTVISATAASTEKALGDNTISVETAQTIDNGLDEADRLADSAANIIAEGGNASAKLDAAMNTAQRYANLLEKESNDE